MNENFSKQFSLLLFALFLSLFLPAQLVVNTSQTPMQLAQLLTGAGVQISNPQVHGGANSSGKYTATSTPLNISQGVLLTTGLATNAIGPNNTSSKSSHFGNLNVPNTYPMLTNYTGKTIYEYSEIEFDIVPQGTQLKFDYVFASEEYEEWVCSQFNDVFGFFISGPGITPDPGNAPYRNIARLPNSNTVVSINTVNQNTNSQYYNNNNNGVMIQYDGFTDVLTAIANVQPCQTYHLKLVVADASDKCWDSGVFIEKISCPTTTLSSSTVTGLPHMIEGCNNGTITFTRQQVTNQSLVVNYWLGGTATNGVDFPLIGGSSNPATMKQITIPANQASASITVAPIADNLNEPIEWLTVYLGNPNCQVNTMDSLRFYIHNQLSLSVSPSVAICVGGNTQLTATSNATTYSWSPSTGLSNPNISNPIASPSVTTTYTVTATLGSCTATQTVTVTVNSPPQPTPITGNTVLCPVNCTGNFYTRTQGGWGVYPSGGNGGTYLHANFTAAFPAGLKIGCTSGNSLTFTTAQAITNFLPQGSTPAMLPSGTFTNTISGSSALWGQITAAMLNVGFDLYDANFSSSNAHLGNLVYTSGTFSGMTVQQVINEANNKIGGCGSTYSLSALCNALDQFNNNYNNCNNGHLACVPNSTTTLSSSPAGGVWTSSNTNVATVSSSGVVTAVNPGTTTITYTITNACGSASVTTVVTVGSNVVPPAAITGNLSVCIGGTTSLSSSTSGGTWSSSNTAVATVNSSTGVVTGVSAGTATITYTITTPCGSASVTALVTVNTISASISAQTNVNCFGGSNGSATVSVSGGTAPYSYNWNTTPVQTGATATNLSAGAYVVTVTSANGCSATASVTITQPVQLGVTASANILGCGNNVACFGGSNGSAMATVTGGTAPYTYLWMPGGATGATASGLAAGTYTVTVTDANNCTASATVTLTQPPAVTATISASANALCFGGSGSATATGGGGMPPYTYSWNTTPVQTTATATGLVAGTYIVTVKDANNCTATASVTITQPASLSASISAQTNPSCFGNTSGSATVSVSGGTAPFSYSWNTTPVQTGATASGLGAGTYIVTVTDANNCSATASVVLTQPSASLSASISAQTNVNCFGNSSGSATVSVSGGTAPYSYSWSTTPVQTGATATGLAAGTYTVTIFDANQCSTSATVCILQPHVALSASISGQVNANCFGGNGSATVVANGGTAPYSYSWNTTPVQTGATASGLAAGTYIATVTDANGCTATASVTISQPSSALSVSISSMTNASCFGGNGSATATVTGGTAPYSYSWNTTPVQTGATATLAAGTYMVTVVDANGCTGSATVCIVQPSAPLSASISGSTNVNCFGNANGSATVVAAGGTAPYSYSWNTTPVQTGATASGLAAGTYIATVTDANGCTATASVIISQPASALSASISGQVNANCFGGNGSATVLVSGGTAPYTYSWNTTPVQTSATATGLAAGTYVVTVFDANQCSTSASVTITQPQMALGVQLSGQINVDCFGGSNGSASVAVSGGTAPYTYSWNTTPVQTSATASGLAAGTYIVTILDANGCTATGSVIITQPAAALSASISAGNINCFGGSSSATVSVSGGTAPYSYSWNTTPVQTSATATGLAAGSYTVTIIDANGCQASASVTISQPAQLSVSASSSILGCGTNITCFGGSDGSATATVTGGTAPYTYLWSNGSTSATATGLAAGTHTVTVTDANGCTATASVTLTQPPPVTATITTVVNANCFGGNGSATVVAGGGMPPFTYSWNTTPVQTSATATGLSAGVYVVTVTDASNCSASATVTISQPQSSLSASISGSINASCFGGSNGSATVAVTGGTAPYSYSWNTTPVQTGATATGLAAGTYVVTVLDANGCTATASVIISQPAAALSASISGSVNASCFGGSGSATVSVTGGTAPYTYSWNTTPVQTSATASGLAAGTYVVSIVDANGCQASASVTITQPSAALSASISAQNNVSCFGGNDGSATVSVSGGTAPYSYSWNTTPVQTGATATGLAAGTYVVTIYDANQCSTSASVTISQPIDSLNASIIAQTNANCFGGNGSATVLATGGTAPYSYSWNTTPVQTSATATGLAAGSYVVTVVDANGCSASASVTISQPAQLSVSASAHLLNCGNNIPCFGSMTGSAMATVTGGTGPYTYIWSPIGGTGAIASGLGAGTYTVTVTDANGCSASATVTLIQPPAVTATISGSVNANCFGGSGSATVVAGGGVAPYTYSWSTIPVQTSATATGLAAGTYVATVTDANGCSATASVTITQPSAALSASISAQNNASCFGSSNGSATVSVSGGTAPYSYSWNTTPVQTGATATGLAAGTYVVTIFDANQCSTSVSVTISQPSASLSASISAQTNVSCFGGSNGSATVSVSGGTAPYSYSWNTTPVQTGATASGLGAGAYIVTITDANGCSASASVVITQPQMSLSASISAQANVSCFGSMDGSATVSVSGGTAPYSYSWNTTPVQTSATASGLGAGVYTVSIVDANGCSASASVTITQPQMSLSASISAQNNVRCFGGANGAAVVSVSGGTAPYTFSWNTTPVQTNDTATGLSAGTYVVTVFDANQCSASATVVITQPAAPLSASISAQTNVSCFGGANGSATVLVTGGTAPYQYIWNVTPLQFTPTATGLAAGTYVVSIVDANNCQASATVTITEPANSLSASISAQINNSCFGDSLGSASVSVSGGTAPYSYSWNTIPAQTGAVATGLGAGTYIVTVTDANGCSDTASVTISQPQMSLSASISAQTNVDCFGNTNGSATVSVVGGTAPYLISWNTTPIQLGATATGLAAGTYIATIVDANGCSASASVTITGPSASLSASISAQTNVNCFGGATGSATVSASGGTAPYSYSWNTIPVQTGATASGLAAGTYIVTVIDANQCVATDSVTISQPLDSLDGRICPTCASNVLCFGDSTGTAIVTVSGGVPPYTYSWNTNPVQTTQMAVNLPIGTYIVTVTDANGCQFSDTVSIMGPSAPLSASISAQANISCFGSGDGSATVSVSGGTAPYSYSWNTVPVQTGANASGLGAGTYIVVVTDANGCTASASVTITEPSAALSASIGAQTNVNCFGNANGSATVSVSGGTAPYSYSWNTTPIQTGATASGLSAGVYVVTITDANGCEASVAVTITQPAGSLSASIDSSVNVSCFGGSNGSATVMVSGGTAPYSYSWNTTPIQTGATASGLVAGTYIVTITDANGCSASASVVISQPQMSLSASISAQTNVACFGDSLGSATVLATGGTAPYSYSWNTVPAQTGAIATGLAAGTYVVTITDANGCSASASVVITQPQMSLSASISAQADVSCFGSTDGSATVSVSGGTAPYSYSWNTIPVQTGATASGLAAGTYIVTVIDANGCIATASVTISQPSAALSASISAQAHVNCFGGANGSATVSVSGGTAPYSYSWNTTPIQTGATASGLVAGTYVVTITDANGCSVSTSVVITQPALSLSASISAQTNVDCFGNMNGSATVSVSGGTAPYSYSWNTIPAQTGATASGLAAGTYIVSIVDANGCQASASVIISGPTASLSASISAQTNVNCFGSANGSATVSVSGGTAPYSYSWNTIPAQTGATASGLAAGTYIVTVTDANGCSASASVVITEPASSLSASLDAQTNVTCFGGNDGSATITVNGGTAPYSYSWNTTPIQTNATASGLTAGAYIATVTDANGCSVTVSVTITQPSSTLLASISAQTNVSCHGGANGSATVSVSGGTAPYSYSWNTTPMQTGATASGLAAGTYVVTISDANDCITSVTVVITQPQLILNALITAQADVDCYGNANGSATVLAIGGIAPYSYSWNTVPVQTGTTASGLAAGTYVVTVTDANGCTASASVTILGPSASLSASISAQTNVSCFGGNDGSATVSVSGGTAPYSYSWNTTPVQTGATANGLAAGTYVVTVTDANGCSASASVSITQPAVSISASISAQTNVNCFGDNTGSAMVSVSGGTAPYTYSWNTTPIQTGATASGLVAGTYIVTITDANGCSASASVVISQPAAALSASVSAQTNVDCFGGANGSATVSVSGGTAPYLYSWNTNPAQTGATAIGLSAGAYIVAVTDVNGCSVNVSVNISEPAALTLTSSVIDANCSFNTGAIDLGVSGGTMPFTYAWSGPNSFSASSQDVINLGGGSYSVIVTDANGCSATLSATVQQSTPIVVSSTSSSFNGGFNVSCNGSSDGSINLSITGGNAPYTYAWSGPNGYASTSQNISGIGAGSYTVTVSDGNGCQAQHIVVMNEPMALTGFMLASSANCSATNGALDLTLNGGVSPYTYLWSNGSVQQDLTDLSTGTYTVIVSDANGCTTSLSGSVSSTIGLAASGNVQHILCYGDHNGMVDVTVSNGLAPYTYSWSNGATTEDLTNVEPGTYILTVTDGQGCSMTDTFVVSQPAQMTLALSSPAVIAGYNISNFGGNDGSIELTVNGGTSPYTYVWSNGSTTQNLDGLPAGTYSVTTTDANGCVAEGVITLLQPLDLAMPTGFSPNADGQNDFFVVQGLEAFPNSRLEIYNRWGNLVFDADNYNNKWFGENNNGDHLPDATYFVILSVNGGEITLKNYVDIRR